MKGDDSDWQDAAFNTRHLHNRLDRGGQSGNTRHQFQVRNTFGTHLVKCATLDKLQQGSAAVQKSDHGGGGGGGGGGSSSSKKTRRSSSSNSKKGSGASPKDIVLDMYRLTDDQDGLLGSLKCPGVFEATVVFAGSRKTLWKITHGLEGEELPTPTVANGRRASKQSENGNGATKGAKRGDDDQEISSSEEGEEDDEDDDEDDEDDEEDTDEEEDGGLGAREARQRRRFAKFEKNSFRQPKFWFRWQGNVVDQDDSPPALESLGVAGGAQIHGSGYVVFNSNDCKRFQGTLTSEQLAWNNVKMTGFKTKPQPERDFEIQWTAEP